MPDFNQPLPWLNSDPKLPPNGSRILRQYDRYAINDLYLSDGTEPFLVQRCNPYGDSNNDLLSAAIAKCPLLDRYRDQQWDITLPTPPDDPNYPNGGYKITVWNTVETRKPNSSFYIYTNAPPIQGQYLDLRGTTQFQFWKKGRNYVTNAVESYTGSGTGTLTPVMLSYLEVISSSNHGWTNAESYPFRGYYYQTNILSITLTSADLRQSGTGALIRSYDIINPTGNMTHTYKFADAGNV